MPDVFSKIASGDVENTNTEETTTPTNDDPEPQETEDTSSLSVLDKFNFDDVDPAQEKDGSAFEVLSRDRSVRKGQFLPNVEEFREYESWFGGGIGEDPLATERIDPRFQDLPLMRAKAQGVASTAMNTGLKFIPQTLAKTAELAGYIGDLTAYDDAFRGLANYVAKKADGEEPFSEDYEDVGNFLSEIGRKTNTTFDNLLPTYRQDPSKVWAPGDPAWWMNNIGNVGETVAAFGGISSGVSRGLGFMLKGAARGAGAGAAVNTTRGGAKAFKYADYGTTAGTALSTSYAEGMMVGMQRYKKTYDKVYNNLRQKKGVSDAEAKERASKAAGQEAATAAGINSVILPFFNLTQAATLVRSRRGPRRLMNQALEGQKATFEGIEEYAQKIGQERAGINFFSREATELARESAFESAEELGARISEVEAKYVDEEDAPGPGERLSQALFSPQSALEATMGALAGAGQQGIMRSIPTIEDPSGEGRISQRQLEWQRDAEFAAKEKKQLEERVNEMVEAKNLLAQAEETDNDVEAQELRDKAMTKIRATLTADNIARGVENQLKGVYRSIENMSDDKAESLGFDTDPESDQYYKDVARDERERVEEYTQEYEELNEQYNFTTQEEFAGVPRTLLNLRIQEDNAKRRKQELEDAKRELENRQPDEEDFDKQARLDAERDIELENLRKQQEALRNLRETFSKWDEESLEGLTFRQFVEDFGGQNLREQIEQARESLPNELFESIQDLGVQDALDFADYVISKRESRIDELDNLKTEAYKDFLRDRDLEDSQEARRLFQIAKEQVKQDYKRAYKDIDKREAYAELKADVARKRYNYFTQSKGREQLLERVKGFFEDVKETTQQEAKNAINNAETEEEVRNLMESYPELVTQEVAQLANNRIEEIRTSQKRTQQENQMDPESQEAEEDAENIADEVESTVEAATEEEPEVDESEVEDERSFGERLADTVGLTDSEEDTETDFAEGVAEEAEDTDTVDLESTLRDSINRYVDNRDFESVEDVEERVRDFVSQKMKEREGIKGLLERNEDLEDSLIRQAKDRYRNNRADQESMPPKREEEAEADRPVENISDDQQDFSSDVEHRGKKAINSGRNIVYQAIDYDEEVTNQEFVVGSNGRIDPDLTQKLRNLKELVDDDLSQEELDKFREKHNIEQREVRSKTSTTTERRDELEYPLIESRKVLQSGANIEYRVLTEDEAVREGFTTEALNEGVFREDIEQADQINDVHTDNAAIGIYHNGNLLGYLRRPDSIHEGTTATDLEGVSDNIARNKAMNRGIRKTVLKQLQEGNERVPGKVRSKNPGHLTINRDENGDKEFQSLEEAFPQDNTFFVIRQGSAFIGPSQDISSENLLNNDSFFETNEGTAGVILTMGNGRKLAVPIWLPRLREIEDTNVPETVFQIGMGGQEGTTINSNGRTIDLSDPDAVEQQIRRYIYSTSDSISNILQREGKRRVHVTTGDQGVAVINQRTGEVYHSNPDTADRVDGFDSWTENKDRVKELLGEMRLNSDLYSMNESKAPTDRADAVLRVNDEGSLEIEEFRSYNDFLKRYAQTDIDSNYSLTVDEETEYLPYEQPTVDTEPTIDENRGDDTNPDIPPSRGPSGDQSGPSDTDTSNQSEGEVENEEESDVDGDSQDTTTPDSDQTTDYDKRAQELASTIRQSEDMETVNDYIEANQEEVEQEIEYTSDNFPFIGTGIELQMRYSGNLGAIDEKIKKYLDNPEEFTEDDFEAVKFNLTDFIKSVTNEDETQLIEESQLDPIRDNIPAYVQVLGDIYEEFEGYRVYEELESNLSTTETRPTVEASTASDLRDQIEEIMDQMEEEAGPDFQSQLDEIDTSVNQSTDELNDSIQELNELEDQMEESGRSLEDNLYNEVKEKRSKLEDELVDRGRPNDRQETDDTGLTESEKDALGKGLGLNQDLSQNTYTPNGVVSKDMEVDNTDVSEDILQSQIEKDIADGKLNIKCRRS